MIDIAQERVVTFAQAAELLPRRRRGRKTHVSTIHRWAATQGLEWIQVGGSRCTSIEALQRFFERRTDSAKHVATSEPVLRMRTLAQRQRAAEAAGKRLEQMGA